MNDNRKVHFALGAPRKRSFGVFFIECNQKGIFTAFTGTWRHVTCKRCLRLRKLYDRD